MSSASVDRLLALLIAGLVATGLVSLWQGAPAGGWVFLGHAWLAGMLTLAVAVKLRASVPRAIRARRWGALALSTALTLGVVAALVGGYLWAITGRVVWVDVAGLIRWSVLTIHAWIGLVVLPVVVLHLLPRRWRLLRPGRGVAARAGSRLLTRRSFLAGAAVGVGGVALGSSRSWRSGSAVGRDGSPARDSCHPASSRPRRRSSARARPRSMSPRGGCRSVRPPSRSASSGPWASAS